MSEKLARALAESVATPEMKRENAAKLVRAAELKEEGNKLFKAGDVSRALTPWNSVFLYLNGLIGLTADEQATATSLRLTCELNLAQAHHKLGNNIRALKHATAAVDLAPGNAKALFRRGRAHRIAGNCDKAKADLEAALAAVGAEPAQAAEIRAEQQLLAVRMAQEDADERRTFAAAFRRSLQDI